MDEGEGKTAAKNGKTSFDPAKYQLCWRACRPPCIGRGDLLVSRNTPTLAHMKRCRKLLNSGMEEVRLHATGAAINRAIGIALQLKKEALGSLDLQVTTSSVTRHGDLVPRVDSVDYDRISARTSAIQIRIFKPDLPASDF